MYFYNITKSNLINNWYFNINTFICESDVLFLLYIGPATVKDLWIPNPLAPQLEFNNAVLIGLYEAIYDLIPPIQFKNEVLEQRHTRWKIQRTVNEWKKRVNNLLRGGSKDGNSQNIQRFSTDELGLCQSRSSQRYHRFSCFQHFNIY